MFVNIKREGGRRKFRWASQLRRPTKPIEMMSAKSNEKCYPWLALFSSIVSELRLYQNWNMEVEIPRVVLLNLRYICDPERFRKFPIDRFSIHSIDTAYPTVTYWCYKYAIWFRVLVNSKHTWMIQLIFNFINSIASDRLQNCIPILTFNYLSSYCKSNKKIIHERDLFFSRTNRNHHQNEIHQWKFIKSMQHTIRVVLVIDITLRKSWNHYKMETVQDWAKLHWFLRKNWR